MDQPPPSPTAEQVMAAVNSLLDKLPEDHALKKCVKTDPESFKNVILPITNSVWLSGCKAGAKPLLRMLDRLYKIIRPFWNINFPGSSDLPIDYPMAERSWIDPSTAVYAEDEEAAVEALDPDDRDNRNLSWLWWATKTGLLDQMGRKAIRASLATAITIPVEVTEAEEEEAEEEEPPQYEHPWVMDQEDLDAPEPWAMEEEFHDAREYTAYGASKSDTEEEGGQQESDGGEEGGQQEGDEGGKRGQQESNEGEEDGKGEEEQEEEESSDEDEGEEEEGRPKIASSPTAPSTSAEPAHTAPPAAQIGVQDRPSSRASPSQSQKRKAHGEGMPASKDQRLDVDEENQERRKRRKKA